MNPSQLIKVSDYMAEFIFKKGIKNVFMLSGTGSIHLDDAFAHQKGIQHICARHEAAAAMMAEASAKLTGDVAVVVATTENLTSLSDEQTVDGISLTAGDRILVKDQLTKSDNGIYIVVSGDSWTRTTAFLNFNQMEQKKKENTNVFLNTLPCEYYAQDHIPNSFNLYYKMV